MVYFTPAFRTYVATPESKKYSLNPWTDPIGHIQRQIAHANCVLQKNEIPVMLNLHCIEELKGFVESSDPEKRLRNFRKAKKALKPLLNSADIAVLMTGSSTEKTLGTAFLGPAEKTGEPPIAWVFPVHDWTLIHEIGHLFGCLHNREAHRPHKIKSNAGFLVEESNMATINAYFDETHDLQIPYFSSNIDEDQ